MNDNLMKYKVALFDADGVTFTEGQLFSEILAEKRMINSLAKTASFFKGPFQQCLVGKADLKEELSKVVKEWGWSGTVDELINFWFTVGNEIDEAVSKYIHNLKDKGVSCYLVTNQEKYRGELLRIKLAHLFERTFVSAEIGYRKEDPSFFEYVYNDVKAKVTSKQEILLIDDDPKNIGAARQFGIDAIHFRTSADLPPLA